MMPSAPSSAPMYLIIRAETIPKLVIAVDPKLAEHVWECVGAPFKYAETGEWCQAIARTGREEVKKAKVSVK